MDIISLQQMDQFDFSQSRQRFGAVSDVKHILDLFSKYGKENVMKVIDYSVKDEDGYVWGLRADQLKPVLDSKNFDFISKCLDLKKQETDTDKQSFYSIENLKDLALSLDKYQNKDDVTDFVTENVLSDKTLNVSSMMNIIDGIRYNNLSVKDMALLKQRVVENIYQDAAIDIITHLSSTLKDEPKKVFDDLVSSNPEFINKNISNIAHYTNGGVNIVEKATQRLQEHQNSNIEDCILETINHYKELEKSGTNPVTPRQHVDKNDSYYHRMYGLYAGMTTKSGKLVFNGKGDKSFDVVVDYMASLPEVSKEATSMRMLTELVQDELVGTHVLEYLPREGEVNPLIMKEIQRFYDAYINNIPFDEVLCPTVDVKNPTDIEIGEVFEVKGENKIYIKNEDGTSTQLDMDKATYCKLFPPIERVASTQNEIGNCWQITGFNGLLRDPVERQNVLGCFHQDGNTITVKFPNGQTGGISFENGSLPKGADPKLYSQGALGLNLLEFSQAIEMQRDMINKK